MPRRKLRPSPHRARCAIACLGLLLAIRCPGDAPAVGPLRSLAEPAMTRALRAIAIPLESPDDLAPALYDRIGNARLVLLGEASHGTSEFYRWRAAISRHLIEQHGFNFVAVEGDWATLWELNRYVKELNEEATSGRAILQQFTRWPTWMWANEETLELIEWMRTFNADRARNDRVGFYGIDVYGQDTALSRLRAALHESDEKIAAEVQEAYAHFDVYRGDFHQYARAVAAGAPSLQPAAQDAYRTLRQAAEATEADPDERDRRFALSQKAKVIQNAEAHFRLMATPGAASWNARVDHFHATVLRLLEWYGPETRGVVWAHNTHIGDARATAMGHQGQHNIGQLTRQHFKPDQVVAIGFGTYRGTVQAGRQWGHPMETMRVPPGQSGSLEEAMHRIGHPAALFLLDEPSVHAHPVLQTVIGHRAIGVVYQPEREHRGNYVPTILPQRYDAFIFIDETQALHTLRE